MRIGIITVWFERGASYVSRQYKKLLEAGGNEVFIFARGGIPAKDDPSFNNDNVTWAEDEHIPIGGSFNLRIFKRWLLDNKIETVFFNEQKWLEPVVLCNELGIKTGSYIDYYTRVTVPYFRIYDFMICNTRRHFSVFSHFDQCFYVPWGTETELFKPISTEFVNKDIVTFFHSCGFSPERKGTDILIYAFSKVTSPGNLVIHSQTNLNKKLYHQRDIIKKLVKEGRLIIITKTVRAPGLYHMGDVYVYPTRLEGIGLTIVEALSCGLPVIVSDNGPMNEFLGKDCGSLIKVRKYFRRKDDYYWDMCEADTDNLSDILSNYARDLDKVKELKKNARTYALENLDWEINKENVLEIFNQSKIIPAEKKADLLLKIKNEDYLDHNNFKYKLYKISPGGYRIFHSLFKPHA